MGDFGAVLLFVVVSAVVSIWSFLRDWSYELDLFGFALFIVPIFAAFIVLVVLAVSHAEMPGVRADYAELRVAAAQVKDRRYEVIAGQVSEANRNIRAVQRYNQIWWSGWAVPDGWDDIETIDMP